MLSSTEIATRRTCQSEEKKATEAPWLNHGNCPVSSPTAKVKKKASCPEGGETEAAMPGAGTDSPKLLK